MIRPVSGQLALVYSALLSGNVYPCFIGMSVLKAGDLEVGHVTKHTLSGSCASNCSSIEIDPECWLLPSLEPIAA